MKRGVLVIAVGAGLLAAGCGTGRPTSMSVGAAGAGVAYEEAVLAGRWGAVCALETGRLRDTTVARCAAYQAGPDDQSAGRQQDEALPGVVGVDGSPLPAARAATADATRPATRAPVRVTASVAVAASGTHPTGVGLLVEHRADDGPVVRALRLVQQNGLWRVDQVEEIVTPGGGPQAVRTALETE